MKQVDKIKSDIQKISSPMEMAGYLDGVRVAAALFCKDTYPDEVIFEGGQLKDISVYGLSNFFDSEKEDPNAKENRSVK